MHKLQDALLYINGTIRKAHDGKTYDNISPWTGDVVGQAADASEADVEEAIVAARKAFDFSDWSSNHAERRRLIAKFRDVMMTNRDRLIEISRIEAGTALGATTMAPVDTALAGIEDLLICFDKVSWEEDRGVRHEMGIDSHRTLLREPVGVVGAITPWNVPLYVNVGKVISALLAGCTVILKPAPDTPLMASIWGEFAQTAGFPPGVLNVVTSAEPAMAGELLVTDDRVDSISFTGSTAVGRRIMEKGAPTLKRLFLELGGKSAKIILDDVEDFAYETMSSIAVFHAGQGCAMATRLLVPRSRYQEAISALEVAYEHFHWGDFEAADQIMGPVVSKKQHDRVLGYINVGIQEGARLLAGGKSRPDKGSGFFIEPTCFVDVTNDMRIAREEIFGPVLVVIPYEDDDDAIRIANDSEYGLGGMVAGGDRQRALAVAKRIRSGAISVNGGVSIAADIPFGGYKASGIGREWGVEGIEEYLETKVVSIKV